MRRLLPVMIVCMLLGGIMFGEDYAQRRQEALQNLRQRALEGDAKALYDLARLYDTGFDSIPVDTLKSNALYLLSAQKGYAPARNFIGFRYYNGDGLKQDTDSALYWIREAAFQGDATAASNLGYLLTQSEKLPHDYDEGIKWLMRAAEAGVPSAMSQLGDLKREGRGGEPDTVAAISYYERAAEAGMLDADLKLLNMMGYKWKELSPDTVLCMGIDYYTGYLPISGLDLLRNAADAGLPKAMALLGDAYAKGIGTEYDHTQSLKYFHEAALAGDVSAQYILAELLEFFPDSFHDHGAQYWYDCAASSGVTDAETAYQLLYTYP